MNLGQIQGKGGLELKQLVGEIEKHSENLSGINEILNLEVKIELTRKNSLFPSMRPLQPSIMSMP